MRYLGMSDIREVDRMTFREYRLRMKAVSLGLVDRERELYLAAWLIREAQAKKKKGKNGMQYIYKKWEDFFDYESRIEEVKTGEKNEKPFSGVAARYAEYMKRGEHGEL